MTGIKGQKWGADKKAPPKVKCNVSLEEPIYNKVKKISDKKEWSINKVLNKIIGGYFNV
jgi:hypothetical protein